MSAWDEQLAKLTPAKRALLERMRKQSGSDSGIRPRDRGRPTLLSYAQQRLWLVHQLDPESYLFNVPRGLRLRGALNIPALERGLSEIVRRHEVLRTVFAGEADSLEQVVLPVTPIELPVSEIAAEDAVREAIAEFRKPFDLARGPMLRARLWRVGEDDHILLIVLHHIVSDAWTAAILFEELSALYGGGTLAELPAQYADYAAWQREYLSGERLRSEIAWWVRNLEGAPAALRLPLDMPRPMKETSPGAMEVASLPLPLLKSVRDLSRQESATLYMTLLAAYSVLLARYSGQDDIVTGTDFSTRTNVETEKMIGFFINLLPIRVRVTGNTTFRELVGMAKQAALDAYAHPDLPFERLVEELKPERVPSRHPVVQVLLVMQNIPRAKREMEGLRVSDFEVPFNTSKFDLALFVEEKPDGLLGQWVYHADLFWPETIRKMAGHFETLLASAVALPDLPVKELAMFSEAEQREREEEERKAKRSKLSKLMKTAPTGVGLGKKVSEPDHA